MTILLLGLIVFIGIHSVRIVADGRRADFIAERGEQTYKGIYSVASLIGLALIVYGYGAARAAGPAVLYDPPFWMRHVAYLLMAFSFVSLAAMEGRGRIKAALKHPMLVGIKLWAFAHLLVNGDVASVVLFGAFLAWAVADRISVKRRAEEPSAESAAISVRSDVIAVVAGLALYLVFLFWAHGWLIGVPLVAL